jgi:hypothetical protein
MDPVLARIDSWQHAGLIDSATADRLRADVAAPSPVADRTSDSSRQAAVALRSGRRGVSASDILGPGPTVAEMFAYLGAGFMLAAWTAFVGRLSGEAGNAFVIGAGLLVAAIALGAVGLTLRAGDDRRRRGAGMAFLGATGYSVGAAAGFLSALHVTGSGEAMVLALIAVAVASSFRFLHAGMLTQLGLLASVTATGASFLALLNDLVAPRNFTEKGEPIGAGPDPLLLILGTAIVWLLVALGLGLLALREADAQRDSAAAPGAPARRAALTRAWAGTVAVVGLASALTRSDVLANGEWGRVVTPWIADAILLGLAALLVERAFRRDSGAFLFAAGLGLIAALTDFNFSYLSSSSEIGLLIEGGLLLAVGFGADRLRRRLGRPGASIFRGEPQPSDTAA